jgi:magnesium-transporting ATPase (P-type)
MALLKFAKNPGWANYKVVRDAADVVQMMPFSSDRKAMGCVVRLPDGVCRLFIKGASGILTRKCTRHVVVHRDGANEVPGDSGSQGLRRHPLAYLRKTTSHARPLSTLLRLCVRSRCVIAISEPGPLKVYSLWMMER